MNFREPELSFVWYHCRRGRASCPNKQWQILTCGFLMMKRRAVTTSNVPNLGTFEVVTAYEKGWYTRDTPANGYDLIIFLGEQGEE